MKKIILGFFLSLFIIFPTVCAAKKVTCSNDKYNAIIEIDKEKLSVNENAFITVTSEYTHEILYNFSGKDLLEIDENGVIKALKEGKVTINVEVRFLEDEKVQNSCKIDLPIEVVSSDSSLKLLTLEEIDISQIFQTDKYEYEVNLPYKFEKINIIAEANNKNAKITGDGRRYLNEGNNEYEIVVTATDGTTSTYKIIIIREDANDDVTLKSLIIEGYVLSPKFDKDTYKYYLNVDKDVEEITINAEASYEFAKINGIGKHILATGKNTYKVIVTAENGNEASYEIEINKNNGSSKLKKLSIVGFNLDSEFDSDKYIYNINVKSDVNKLEINTEALDDEQVEIIGNESLVYGENDIIIRVTGSDKSTTTYKIVVNKLSIEEEQKIENNSILLKILFIMFVGAIIIMITFITIFIKRNYKRNNIRNIKNMDKIKKE